MSKITKKQYEKEQYELLLKINKLDKILKSLPSFEEIENLPQSVIDSIGETWNNTNDAIDELKKELRFLDQRWSRRNWTHQEWAEHELITNNID